MDAWSADQLRKMQAGGNGKLNAFLRQYGVDPACDTIEKYNSRAAEVSPQLNSPRHCLQRVQLLMRMSAAAAALEH